MLYTPTLVHLRQGIFGFSSPTLFSQYFLDTIVDLAPQKGKVLDIGTGNGYIAIETGKRRPDLRLYGIDNSPESIDLARIKAKEEGVGVEFKVGNNYRLPFEEQSLDVITAKNVTRFSAKEVYRVLADDGYFFFREYGPGKGIVEVAELFQGRLIRSRNPSYYLTRLSNAGFEEISLMQTKIPRLYTFAELAQIMRSYPLIREMTDVDLALVENRLFPNGPDEKIQFSSDPIMIIARKS